MNDPRDARLAEMTTALRQIRTLAYDKLADLDRQALRTVEAYCRMTQEASQT